MYFVHKGVCDRTLKAHIEKKLGKGEEWMRGHTLWNDLDTFLKRLQYNIRHPIETDRDAEYVIPNVEGQLLVPSERCDP